MDDGVFSWKQEGVLSLWRYTEFRNKFGGWHLTGNDAGVESLLSLLRLLAGDPGAYRTVTVTPPSASILRVPNYQQGDALWAAPSKWRLQCAPSGNADTWKFPLELEPAALTISEAYLPALIAGLDGIPKGEGDFCIGRPGQGNLALWFWWWPGAA
ncbi:hypothetical protein [Montanilutibacter psychrotolerans]|uniref:Uncharacterized protein n=1 Tax=Montanilutibacter psychrotolerans TaxID=1327343 RepID=A0A3M8SYH0_9GAMM|nr:hypothetical protein [Lysobacter psychrotolerans]RNF84486.1 hypothetical protein EER27_08955 [Lysobacter psychrotolerans]